MSHSIDCVFWDDELKLEDKQFYSLHCVNLDTTNGYMISDYWGKSIQKKDDTITKFDSSSAYNITINTLNYSVMDLWTEVKEKNQVKNACIEKGNYF
jgi:hypothetical protein